MAPINIRRICATLLTSLSSRFSRFIAQSYRLPIQVWARVRKDPLLTAVVGPLLVLLIIALAGLAITSMRSLTADEPSVVEKIGEQESWTSAPTLFPGAERVLETPPELAAPRSRFDPDLQVRTAQELADDAPSLTGETVIVVGRVAAIESRESPDPDLGTQEISLLGDDQASRAVVIGGVSVGRFPPPLVPIKPGRLVPLPGSMQRFEPDFEYGVFLGMVAAVGTTTSADGGPVRTAYVIAAEALLTNDKRADLRLGPAVQQALNDL